MSDMLVAIPLRRRDGSVRAVAFVDPIDAAQAEHRWSLHSDGYAVRQVDRRAVLLHREIMGCTRGDGIEIDHENGNRLDNRRSNLRLANRSLNGQNRRKILSATGLRGVSLHKASGLYIAYARLNGRRVHLGYRRTPEAAAALSAQYRAEHMPYSADAAERRAA